MPPPAASATPLPDGQEARSGPPIGASEAAPVFHLARPSGDFALLADAGQEAGEVLGGETRGGCRHLLERAARLQVLAASSGRPLKILPKDVVAKTAAGWAGMTDHAERHFKALVEVVDAEEPDYAVL